MLDNLLQECDLLMKTPCTKDYSPGVFLTKIATGWAKKEQATLKRCHSLRSNPFLLIFSEYYAHPRRRLWYKDEDYETKPSEDKLILLTPTQIRVNS